VRSIFDQYTQPENRLTHALACALHHDRALLVPFLKWLGIREIPAASTLHISQQTVPGSYEAEDEPDPRGLPDLAVFDDDGWAVLFESKVQSGLTADQLQRHAKTAKRSGYTGAVIVAFTVDTPKSTLPSGVIHRHWREVYSWFNQRTVNSFMAAQLIDFFRAFERHAILNEYEIRGTITMFDGLRFDADTPYTYAEAKRLIRLLGDQVQSRSDLRKLGVDPKGARRSAITGRAGDAVWDYLPLKQARGSSNFTAFPHLTMSISNRRSVASITVPNGIKGGFRSNLRDGEITQFSDMLLRIEDNMRPLVKKCVNARPNVYAIQRHYKSQRSTATTDATIEADLRTLVRGGSGGIKHQPEWAEAIYRLIVQKRSNIQFGVEMRFDYQCPLVRSPECADLFAQAWIACKPLLDLATPKRS
jgi:hypothetical protein